MAQLTKIEFDADFAKLEENSQLKSFGFLTAVISHEINTPITLMTLHVDRVLKKLNEPERDFAEVQHSMVQISKSLERISSTIKAVQMYSKNGQLAQVEPTSLLSIVQESTRLCSERINATSIALRLDIEDFVIKCRPIEISQVLINLLNNAHDAVKTKAERWIQITARKINRKIEIRVLDSGDKLDESSEDKIFNSIFTTKAFGEGTGIGLKISSMIVESHGGELFYDPNELHTCFVVRLPA